MTLLEFCKAIPKWGEFIEVENSESRQPNIYVNLCALNYYYDDGHSDGKEYRIMELGFNYFDAIMCNILPCEYYSYSIKHDEEVGHWSSYLVNPICTRILTDFKIAVDQEVREYHATVIRPYYRASGKQLVRKNQIDKPGIFNNGIKSTQHLIDLADKNGDISSQGITSYKYPNTYELINDAIKIIKFYQDVDIVVVFTDLEEAAYSGDRLGFLEHIEFGIWIHDQTLEFMEPTRTRAKYQEYSSKYGG